MNTPDTPHLGTLRAFVVEQRNWDIELSVEMTMFEAAFGCELDLEGTIQDPCGECMGAGANMSCRTCRGTGRRASRYWSTPVKLPVGLKDGRTRIPGFGVSTGIAGLQGDLVVYVRITKNEMFRLTRSGRLDAYVPISQWTWLLGGKVMVPLLDGARLVEFSSMDHEIRIAGQGWPKELGSHERGDLIVNLVPQDFRLKVAQRKFLEQMARDERNKYLTSWDREIEKWAQGSAESRYLPPEPKKKPKQQQKTKDTSPTS
ncbi:DnaJ C-terminal domain-containing protein [Hydrogenophaga sp.]|uniref:DnaJ C-terminal domain-containing protein n=1 Tax=Hydrogenophaga sp. TaxID=1904254 RepID=UPI003AF9CEE5